MLWRDSVFSFLNHHMPSANSLAVLGLPPPKSYFLKKEIYLDWEEKCGNHKNWKITKNIWWKSGFKVIWTWGFKLRSIHDRKGPGEVVVSSDLTLPIYSNKECLIGFPIFSPVGACLSVCRGILISLIYLYVQTGLFLLVILLISKTYKNSPVQQPRFCARDTGS